MNNDMKQVVYVVDDDDAVRDALSELLDSVGRTVIAYESATQFLEQLDTLENGCLVLDVRMPGMSGLELQERLSEAHVSLPIIFITGHGDVPMAVEAMKKGAVEFIQKPFRDQELLDCIHSALQTAKQSASQLDQQKILGDRLSSLTRREREVLDCIVNGLASKVIAVDLEISQRTVENHRAHILEKMRVRSTPELLKLMLTDRH